MPEHIVKLGDQFESWGHTFEVISEYFNGGIMAREVGTQTVNIEVHKLLLSSLNWIEPKAKKLTKEQSEAIQIKIIELSFGGQSGYIPVYRLETLSEFIRKMSE